MQRDGYLSVSRVANPIQQQRWAKGGRGRGGARFPPTWFLFPLGRGRARYHPPEEKRSRGGGRTLLSSPPFRPRESKRCTLRCVFQLLGSSNLGGGGGYITLLQSLECFLVMKRPMFRAEEWRRRRRRRVGLSLWKS